MNVVRGLVFALLLAVSPAWATQPAPPDPSAPPSAESTAELQITAAPLFGEQGCVGGMWTEILVVLRNRAAEVRRGTVTVDAGIGRVGEHRDASRTAFEVAPGAVVELRLPVHVMVGSQLRVQVLATDGTVLYESPPSFHGVSTGLATLLDVGGPSALATQLNGVGAQIDFDPRAPSSLFGKSSGWAPASPGRGGANARSLMVVASPREAATAEPILPLRAATYSQVDAVLIRSDALVRMHAQELTALTGWMLAGGTLALIVARPEDLRHPIVTALVGGESKATPVAPETLAVVTVPPPPKTSNLRLPPTDEVLPEALRALASGYEGGNLRPSSVGSTASYGLGEVHLLPLDPTVRPAVDSAWTLVRLVEVVRRANERQASILFRLGQDSPPSAEVRRYLDPNEGARWVIGLAVLLLCLYAVLAGPVNFVVWRRRGTPMKSLPTLVVASAATFIAIVGIAVASKGVHGRALHLTFVDAGGGSPQGAARRFRAFYVPSSRSLTVHASESTAVLATHLDDASDQSADSLVLDRDALRLTNLQLRPWQLHVVREEGQASLGHGIALVREASGATAVVNRTGRALRGLVLNEPGKGTGYLARLESGGRARAAEFEHWAVSAHEHTGSRLVDEFTVPSLVATFDERVAGLGAAWNAVHESVQQPLDWFPADVPTLLAQLEGGEGTTVDSGMRLEHDRLLVRVVGYGGAP